MDANNKNSAAPGSVAFNESPAPMPTAMGPTQVPDPVWGKYNNPQSIVNWVETHIVEL
jgi:hypothetical protein